MSERVFVKVMGFSDVERHALNTVFRLSEDGPVHYLLWAADAPQAPGLALIDGQSYEARLELESPSADPQLKFIWVGEAPPPQAWRTFARPLHWPHVIQAMDSLLGPATDIDLDFGFEDAGPDTVPPEDVPAQKRALVINSDPEQQLYLRARLALAGLVFMDEAVTAEQGLAQARAQPYAVVLADLAQPDLDGWQMLQQLRNIEPPIAHLWLTAAQASWPTRLRARRLGAHACLGKPFDPAQLHALLKKVG